jgi:hypothetical protein
MPQRPSAAGGGGDGGRRSSRRPHPLSLSFRGWLFTPDGTLIACGHGPIDGLRQQLRRAFPWASGGSRNWATSPWGACWIRWVPPSTHGCWSEWRRSGSATWASSGSISCATCMKPAGTCGSGGSWPSFPSTAPEPIVDVGGWLGMASRSGTWMRQQLGPLVGVGLLLLFCAQILRYGQSVQQWDWLLLSGAVTQRNRQTPMGG